MTSPAVLDPDAAQAVVEVYGVRHHGPGSARAVRRALAAFGPDAVLIEGPPEADALVPLAADPGMTPPVALLAYADGAEPGRRRALFWPFAEFSPEWQALRYAVGVGVPVRFCDLPAAHRLAEEDDDDPGDASDPLGMLAEAAGYDDAERWWDDVVEHRVDDPSPFPAIAEAMAELRGPVTPDAVSGREARREAFMRRTLRRARRDGFRRIAVVCGAWHVPALAARIPAAHDDRLLRGLPRAKVALTWVPWTHGRLAGRSGYGAGVRSPGWYHHLFTAPDRPVERWLTAAARVLRAEDLHVSSADVIEAVRLAEALAALRGRPLAGLDEVTEAVRAVLCGGADEPVALVARRLVVGERLGAVPDATPMVPLQRDLVAAQRRLRLRPSAEEKDLDLDLRVPTDLERSRLLHRLRLLEVEWGVPDPDASRSRGTFREAWTVRWRPEFDVRLIEAGVWGTTVADAAAARARDLAAHAGSLADLTALAERCLLADLGAALPDVMRVLADRAAVEPGTAHLMAALPALVRALRYGDVRGTDPAPLRTVVDGLAVRIRIGLPRAATGLDDDAARALLAGIGAVHEALSLLGDDASGHRDAWLDALTDLLGRPNVHGVIDGRVTRLLLDTGRLPDASGRMARAVSSGAPADRAAAWIEGFLADGGVVLVHDDALLGLLDDWLAGLPAETFGTVLPLLRRTFGAYGAAERRAIGERVRRPGRPTGPSGDDPDPARADPAAATVLRILGWETA
ncbi:DUF5682 family protein [Actinomadura rayongensis]|uniref:DUF5682 family protein n=1 Tax=Actinomadura rayongensis TaxID=1429076 RepID=UPI00301BDB6E